MKAKMILVTVCFLAASCATAPQNQAVSNPHAEHQAAAASPAQPRPLPAFFANRDSIPRPLPPTLSPDKFSGEQVRKAYQVAKEIPETLAQLPCFCYCDRGFGHKSLHSCYEDDHSAGCSTCIDEALVAYQLQKEEKLNPEQVRERIIARFGNPH